MLTLARTVNPFVYPGHRLPGFDPAHPASQGMVAGKGISFIIAGATGISLLNAKAFTPVGAILPAANIDGAIGPSIKTLGNGSAIQLAGQSTATPVGITAAVIFKTTIISDPQGLISDGSFLFFPSGSFFQIYVPGFVNSGIVPVANAPYFAAVSYNNTTANFVILNLATGQIQTAAVAGGGNTLGAPTGTVTTTNPYSTSQALEGILSAGMMVQRALSMPQLISWAQDPWSFWYPPAVEQLIFDSMSGPSVIPPIPNPYTLMPQIVT